jgi:hypothetical protein
MYQILNKDGQDAGTDDGRMAIFTDLKSAVQWSQEFLSEERNLQFVEVEIVSEFDTGSISVVYKD